MTNVEKFREAYIEKLTAAVQAHPDEYFYKIDQVPVVVEKMIKALAAGSANIGPAIKAAARKVGIKSTQKAIQEYLKE